MAKQSGIFKIEGTIDDVTFYKSNNGYFIRSRGGVSKNRIKNDPNYQRTRENNEEFSHAGKAGRTLRMPFIRYTKIASDSKMVSRLLKEMMAVLKSDPIHIRGQRKVSFGNLALLEGFEFNSESHLSSIIHIQFTSTIDWVTGMLTVTLPFFIPLQDIVAPAGASHFKIIVAGGEVDFEQENHKVSYDESLEIALSSIPISEINLICTVTASSTLPLFLVLGIEFLQEVNGVRYPLKNGVANCLSIVKVLKN